MLLSQKKWVMGVGYGLAIENCLALVKANKL